MPEYATPPIEPFRILLDRQTHTLSPTGPVLTRRMSALDGLFANREEWQATLSQDPVVYTVTSSPVPEVPRELPQSITTILPGTCGGEFFMTKGHQHPDPQGEIYLGLAGVGGLLMFDGTRHQWLDMEPGVIGYIPPGWAHRSINVGDEAYKFLAVYPGSAGHDYGWVLKHGMGARAMRAGDAFDLAPFGPVGG